MALRALKAHTSTQRAHKALKAHTSTQRAHKALKAHTSTPQRCALPWRLETNKAFFPHHPRLVRYISPNQLSSGRKEIPVVSTSVVRHRADVHDHHHALLGCHQQFGDNRTVVLGRLENVIQPARPAAGPEGTANPGFHAKDKFRTKGTASAVPQMERLMRAFRVCVKAKIFGQNQYDCVLIGTQNQYESCMIFEFSRRLFSP